MVTLARPTATRHCQCAWCQRLKHRDGRPHGRALPIASTTTRGYSHGVCLECMPRILVAAEQAGQAIVAT
jgi:hypothetical protein